MIWSKCCYHYSFAQAEETYPTDYGGCESWYSTFVAWVRVDPAATPRPSGKLATWGDVEEVGDAEVLLGHVGEEGQAKKAGRQPVDVDDSSRAQPINRSQLRLFFDSHDASELFEVSGHSQVLYSYCTLYCTPTVLYTVILLYSILILYSILYSYSLLYSYCPLTRSRQSGS
jgi:hypothetical protein